MDITTLLSPRELLFLGGGAAAFGIGAVLIHARPRFASARARGLVTSLAVALFVAGGILTRAGF